MRNKRFATFTCQVLLYKVKQMNIADDLCQHQLTAMMIQETHMQEHRLHQLESSSGEKLHLYFSGHKNRSICRNWYNSKTNLKCHLHSSLRKNLHDES